MHRNSFPRVAHILVALVALICMAGPTFAQDGVSISLSSLSPEDQARYRTYAAETENPLAVNAWVRETNAESNLVLGLEIASGAGLGLSLWLASQSAAPGEFSIAQPIGLLGSLVFGTVFLTTCIMDALDVGHVKVPPNKAAAQRGQNFRLTVSPMMTPGTDGHPSVGVATMGHWRF